MRSTLSTLSTKMATAAAVTMPAVDMRTADVTLRRRWRTITSTETRTRKYSSERQPPTQTTATTTTTHYSIFPQTFPRGPPPHTSFSPDLRQLRKEYLQLQAKAHPDVASAAHKSHAEALSARINEAYKTLQDPLRRAQYLLAQKGIDVADDSAKLDAETDGGDLLMEVMEAREAVDDVDDEEGLVKIRNENNARIDKSVQILESAFAEEDLATATREAVKLRYWMNIDESIKGWEKGSGGGNNHH